MHQGGVRTKVRAMSIIATAGFLFWGFCVNAIVPSDLVISKLQITGGLGKTSEDYISIYNKTDSAIDLNGLRLVKRTKTGTTDTTIKSWVSETLLNPSSYYTWACSTNDFATSINADSSSTQTIADDNGIAIRDGSENIGIIIDSLGWGSAANAYIETSPYPINPGANQVLTRLNNLDTNNNSVDFTIPTNTPPPPPNPICGNNIIETGETCDDGNLLNSDGCNNLCQIENQTSILGDVMINEIVADPASGDEWLELYNTANKEIDLTNWTIEDGSGSKTLLSGNINKFFVITKPKGALNNAGDIIILKNSDGDIIDSISYGDCDDGDINNNATATYSPSSLARIKDGESTVNDSSDFKVTTTITKGLTNIITETIAEEDEENSNSATSVYDYSRDITISEIFPDPLGLDGEAVNGEFIELYNQGDKNVLLTGWRIEINNLVMSINDNTIIYSKNYLNLSTKNILPLPNDGATVKLFQPLRQTSYQSITYKKSEENKSYANFITNGWQWTARTTPGTENFYAPVPVAKFELIDEPVSGQNIQFDSSDSFLGAKTGQYLWNFGDGATSNLANPQHTFTKTGKTKISLTIKTDYGSSLITKNLTILKNPENVNTDGSDKDEKSETTSKDGGDKNSSDVKIASTPTNNSIFTTAGTAISAVGTFGSQYFYFLPEYGEPLLQIYNSKKLFPKINAGDQLIITGEYTERAEGPRLKTKDDKDIQIIGTDEIVVPKVSSSNDLKNPPYPRLALIEGEVVSKKYPRIYLADKQGEVEIYLTTGTKLKATNFNIGDRLSIFGVLTTLNGVVRLQPRSIDDIKKIEVSDFSVTSTESSITPTESTTIDLIDQPTTSKKKIMFYYLLAGTLMIVGVVGYFVYKK